MKADVFLDARGVVLPLSLIRSRKAITALKPGEVLEVITRDPDLEKDLRTLAQILGHEFLGTGEREGDRLHYIG